MAIERSRSRIARAQERITESRVRIAQDPCRAVLVRKGMAGIESFGEAALQPSGNGEAVLQVPIAQADAGALAKGLTKILAQDGLGDGPETLLAVHLVTRIQHVLYREAMRQISEG